MELESEAEEGNHVVSTQPTKVDLRFHEPEALAEFVRSAKIG
jgi:hypothetical protein